MASTQIEVKDYGYFAATSGEALKIISSSMYMSPTAKKSIGG
jgi:hypothetical protein